MRKAVFLIIAALTYYVASMYQSMPLMILFLIEAALFIGMFILSRHFKRRLNLVFKKHDGSMIKNEEQLCSLTAVNGGALPIGRFGARFTYGYGNSVKTGKAIYGAIDGKSESEFKFTVKAPYCGIVLIGIDRVYVSDYLSLFTAKKKGGDGLSLDMAVFPRSKEIAVELPSYAYDADGFEWTRSLSSADSDSREVRQLREYRTGDSARYVHWNQSAKTDKLWIKEFEKESERSIDLFVEFKPPGEEPQTTVEALDAFYEILSALVLGLLRSVSEVKAHWYDYEKNGFESAEIAGVKDCENMLFRLYKLNLKETEPAGESGEFFGAERDFLRLNTDLDLYYNNNLIYSFDRDRLFDEIEEMRLSI